MVTMDARRRRCFAVSCRCKRVYRDFYRESKLKRSPRAIIRGKLNPSIPGIFRKRTRNRQVLALLAFPVNEFRGRPMNASTDAISRPVSFIYLSAAQKRRSWPRNASLHLDSRHSYLSDRYLSTVRREEIFLVLAG